MIGITPAQYKILRDIYEHGKRGFHNRELTDDHWALCRHKLSRMLVSIGVFAWVLEITNEGIKYVEEMENIKTSL